MLFEVFFDSYLSFLGVLLLGPLILSSGRSVTPVHPIAAFARPAAPSPRARTSGPKAEGLRARAKDDVGAEGLRILRLRASGPLHLGPKAEGLGPACRIRGP